MNVSEGQTSIKPKRKGMKIGLVILAIVSSVVLTMLVIGTCIVIVIVYISDYRVTERTTDQSPDGEYSVLYQNIGEAGFPFGPIKVRVSFYHGTELIDSYEDEISDDGGTGWTETVWYDYGADTILMGSEMQPKHHEFGFESYDVSSIYTVDEAEEMIKTRLGEGIIFEYEEKGIFRFRFNDIPFVVRNTLTLPDNYEEISEFMKYTEDFFGGAEMPYSVKWVESGMSLTEAPCLIPEITFKSYDYEISDGFHIDHLSQWMYQTGKRPDIPSEDVAWYYSYFYIVRDGEKELIHLPDYIELHSSDFWDLSKLFTITRMYLRAYPYDQ